MAVWKIALALAAGNCILKPEQTPTSIMVLMDLIGDLIPPGVLNVVNGFGVEAANLWPVHRGWQSCLYWRNHHWSVDHAICLGKYHSCNAGIRASPNIFFPDIFAEDDAFADKALKGFAMFALNQGEVCTCPSRALVHESIYDEFMEKSLARVKAIKQGSPLEAATMIGAQASNDQFEKILSYIDIGLDEGAELVTGGKAAKLGGELDSGFYIEPTIFAGQNKMRIFQEEIFGPVVSVTKFSTKEEALAIANHTMYGLGAGVWSRDINTAYRFGRDIKAGRVWTNCYHLYPAHAAFGGYKKSGIGRETHKMMLEHYQQTKNMLVSYSPNALGF